MHSLSLATLSCRVRTSLGRSAPSLRLALTPGGAGILWPAAGQLIAAVSTPANRASNAGIYQCAFHIGVFAGGLILGAVQKTLSNWNHQYAVFISLCGTSVICFFIHAITFRRRFRRPRPTENATAAEDLTTAERGAAGADTTLHRVQLEDGTVEYRRVEGRDLKSEHAVVQDLALSGGRMEEKNKLKEWKDNFWRPLQMLIHPVFGPLGPAIFITGE